MIKFYNHKTSAAFQKARRQGLIRDRCMSTGFVVSAPQTFTHPAPFYFASCYPTHPWTSKNVLHPCVSMFVLAGTTRRTRWSSTPTPRTSSTCGRRRCCRPPRTNAKRRGGRRYDCLYLRSCICIWTCVRMGNVLFCTYDVDVLTKHENKIHLLVLIC